ALLFSAIVRPLGKRHPLLPLAVPLAVCETAERLRPGVECKVKCPNDVHLDGRKLAGILIEARPQEEWAVLGIGLNLSIAADDFPAELRDSATSLFAGTWDEARLGLSEALERWVEADSAAILAEWRDRDTLLGREVSWEQGSGVAEGI